MRSIPPPYVLLVGLVMTAGESPGSVLPLDLPVRYPSVTGAGGVPVAAPAYQGDILELRLTAPASVAARAGATTPARGGRLDRLGLADLDRAMAALPGLWLEREFPGEQPPVPGSGEPDFTAFFIAHLPPGLLLEDGLARFRGLHEVASADPIAVLAVAAVPNDSLWTDSYWFPLIQAPAAWDVTTGDTSVVVAVIDTGLLPYHPDLSGTVAGLPGQLWTNWAERGGRPGVDDDSNGYLDDVAGWDFVALADSSNVATGEDWRDADSDPNDFVSHGTAVAGLIGAIANNGSGVAGTAWKIRLMGLRIGWAFRGSKAGEGEVRMDFAAQAIRYATRMGAKIINCSFSTADQSGLGAAVSAATRAGVLVVASAGNGDPFHYLGDREDVLAVTATDANDVVAPFSNLGEWVDLAAPGVGMASTWMAFPRSLADSISARQPGYASGINGTSFAAPVAAGTAALVQARRLAQGQPPLGAMSLLLRLRETCDDIAAQNLSVLGQYGTGRLDAQRALLETSGSIGTPMGARTVGPAVILPTTSGVGRAACVSANREIILLDGASGDTLTSAALSGVPVGNLAAADLGGGRGLGLFVGTSDGRMNGMDARGVPLPGWPVTGTRGRALAGGTALGDLDGDGQLEVLCGDDNGNVFAWRADGSLVANFPVPVSGNRIRAAIALSDLDGQPGAEIIAAAEDGVVAVFRGTGDPLSGWPVNLFDTPLAPVVARLGSSSEPSILVAAGGLLHALAPSGVERAGYPVALGAATLFDVDPAVGDLDLDGNDDIVLALTGPEQIQVRDSAGVMLSALGWPRPVSDFTAGPPVLGHLSGGMATDVLLARTEGLLALSNRGDSLGAFPKPGRGGIHPTLEDLDQDRRTEVVAGTGPDTTFYLYDAGPGSWNSAPQPWPTPRGNFARTGSRLYAPAMLTLDDSAPNAITDLRADSLTVDAVRLQWTAPADVGGGVVTQYELRRATFPLDDSNFLSGQPLAGLPTPAAPGGPERYVATGLLEQSHYWFALRSRDAAGNTSMVAVVSATTETGDPLSGHQGLTLLLAGNPSRVPAVLYWQGDPRSAGLPQTIRIFDLMGRLRRRLSLGNGPRGRVEWDGRDDGGESVPAGLYFVRLESGSFRIQARLVLMP